jgi:hypothetical protein
MPNCEFCWYELFHQAARPIKKNSFCLILSDVKGPFGRAFPSASLMAFTEALPNP